jgi:hypothetical protein
VEFLPLPKMAAVASPELKVVWPELMEKLVSLELMVVRLEPIRVA